MARHRGRGAIEGKLLLGRLWSLLNTLLHILRGELLLKDPVLLVLMLQVHDRFLSILGTHPSELRELGGRHSGYLLTNSGREGSRIHTVDRARRLLEDLAGIHLGYVSHLLGLSTVREHLSWVDAVVHESSLNYLTRSHHRGVRHHASSNTTASVHELASPVVHRRVRRLLHSVVRKFGRSRGRLLELGVLLLGCELGLEVELGLRLLGLGILIGGQKSGVDAVCLCGIHGVLKIWRQRGSTWWAMKHARSLGREGLNDTRRGGQQTETCRDLRKEYGDARVSCVGREGVSVGKRKR